MSILDLSSLSKSIAADYGFVIEDKAFPPVENWHPKNCGDIGIEIRKDGTWWHQNDKISRPELVRLFARILRKDDDGNTYLVTPHEKIIVKVEDAHFIGIRCDILNNGLNNEIIITTNLGELIKLSAQNPLFMNVINCNRRPYCMVRGNLFAAISRNAYYELVNHGQIEQGGLYIYSNGSKFLLGNIDE